MEHYDFAVIIIDASYNVSFFCTDPSEIDALLSQLQPLFPKLKITQKRNLPSGEIYVCDIKGLSNREMDVSWWLIKQLCSRGWDPQGGGGGAMLPSSLMYRFKRKS